MAGLASLALDISINRGEWEEEGGGWAKSSEKKMRKNLASPLLLKMDSFVGESNLHSQKLRSRLALMNGTTK